MVRISSFAALLLTISELAVPVVAGPSPRLPIYPGSEFSGYGKKTDQTIACKVAGDIEHEGEYFLPKESTLLDLILRLGRSGGKGEFRARSIVVTVRDQSGRPQSTKHRFSEVPPEELRKIPLASDALYYIPEQIL